MRLNKMTKQKVRTFETGAIRDLDAIDTEHPTKAKGARIQIYFNGVRFTEVGRTGILTIQRPILFTKERNNP